MFHMKQFGEERMALLKRYVNILYKWNEKINLTSYSEREFYDIALIDCIVLLKVLKRLSIKDITDIGTGYGMPGIVLKILEPAIKVTLIDSSEKKIAFLEYVSKILKLDCEVYNRRLPDRNWPYKFRAIVSKASMKEERLIKVCESHLERGGYLLYFHGLTEPMKATNFPIKGKITYKRGNNLSNLVLRISL